MNAELEPTTTGKHRSVEQILLADETIDRQQLDQAAAFANAVGISLHEAIIQKKFASAETVMRAYAESTGILYLDMETITIDLELARQIPTELARRHSCVPVVMDDYLIVVAAPHVVDPELEQDLRLLLGREVQQVLSTPAAIHDAVNLFYPKKIGLPSSKKKIDWSIGGRTRV